jgi:hypothetical protein
VSLVERGPSRDTTFRTALRGGVWAVTKNNVFYGDYSSREQAIRSACNGARAVEAKGGQARVLALPGDEPIAHRDGAATP